MTGTTTTIGEPTVRHDRYTWAARWYDALAFERPVYRAGRLAGVAATRLAVGDRVLDLGCGTGLNLPLLQAATGPTGSVVGLDRSEQMLALADRRAQQEGWSTVHLVRADATTVTPAELLGTGSGPGPARDGGPFDAVLCTYSLSLMPDWRTAWRTALAVTRPGGRLVVVDMARPTGAARLLTPLALLACRAGGADIDAHPWTAVADLDDVRSERLRGGHIEVWSGRRS
ncbi:MAG: methyltransferase domain-containing protein [Nocardioidaceae bacterium]